MAKRKQPASSKRECRTFTDEFKQEAVQMLLDGHAASSISQNLGNGNTNLIYRWKAKLLTRSGPAAQALDSLEQSYMLARYRFGFPGRGRNTATTDIASHQ